MFTDATEKFFSPSKMRKIILPKKRLCTSKKICDIALHMGLRTRFLFQISHVLVHFNVHVISVERKSTFTSAENEQSIRCNRIAKTIIQYTHCYWSSYRILIQVYFHHIISSFYSQNFTWHVFQLDHLYLCKIGQSTTFKLYILSTILNINTIKHYI